MHTLACTMTYPRHHTHTLPHPHLPSHTERIVQVLEQYKERLHQHGDEGHDEELDYIKQILASPMFYDYVQNSSQLSQEETSLFSEVTNDLLSGFQETTDGKMSPAEKHKQRVQRKRSLRALRNVVTPKNSPRIKSRRPHGGSGANSSDGGKGSSSAYDGGTSLATSPLDRTPGPPPLGSSASGSRYDNSSSSGSISTAVNGKRVQDFTPLTNRSIERDYTPVVNLSNGVIDFDSPSSGPPPPFESPSRNLSNSTGTLIERSTSPSSDDTLLRRSDENLLANGGTPSSGSNVLRGLKSDTTSAYALGNGTGPNSIPTLGGMDWDLPKQPQQQLLTSSSIHDPGPPPPTTTQGLKLKLPPVNVAHRQPPSYHLHMQQQQTHTAPHHQIVTSPQVENKRPPPPPYGQPGGNLMPQRRAKSFDRLLDSSPSDSAIPIHLPPPNQAPDSTTKIADSAPFTQQQPPQVVSGGGLTSSLSYGGNPIVRPMTDGMATTNYLTASERRRTILTVRLEKGEKGLGFRVKGLKSEQFGGGLFVQDLQPGGMAERYVVEVIG